MNPTRIQEHTPFYIDQWLVDPSTLRLCRDDHETRLEPKVMEVLVYLARHAGQLVTREDLERDVWTGTVVGYDALTSTIIKLRKALQDDSRNPRYIETIPKKGYRLLAAISDKVTGDRETGPADMQGDDGGRAHSTMTRIPWRSLGMAAGGLLVVAAIYIFMSADHPAKDRSTGNTTDLPSLVILPFENLNQDPAQEYFSDGITDDLINDLSGYAGLHVIARRSAYVYKARHTDINTIARELGVNYVVDGNIRRDGNRIRINVQLIDAPNGLNIWAQRFEKEVTDIFAVQDDIRESIVRALSVTLSKEERERTQRRYTSDFHAYDLFLKGQAKLVTRASASDSREAQAFMEQAIKLDPGFARAHAALALIHADAYRFDWTNNPAETRQLALTTGQRAIELDDQSPEAHWILGYIYLFLFEEHDRAIELGQRAAQLDPGNMDAATVLAVTHTFGGHPDKAKLIIQELMKRNRRYSAMVPGVLGHANFLLENYPEALAAYNESLQINPSRINGNVYKALALYRMGEVAEAEFQVFQLYALHPDFDVNVWAARQPFRDKRLSKAMIEDLVKAGVELKQQ